MAESYVEAAVAEQTAQRKLEKYKKYAFPNYCFQPIAVENFGALNSSSDDFINTLGRRISSVLGEEKESASFQRFNSILLSSSTYTLLLNFVPAITLIPVHFLNGAIMCYCFVLHHFPVPASFYFVTLVSLSMYFVMRVCWFVCSSSMLRIFGMLSLKKNWLSNSKLYPSFVVLNLDFIILVGFPRIIFFQFLLQFYCLFIPIWISFLSVRIFWGCMSALFLDHISSDAGEGVRRHN